MVDPPRVQLWLVEGFKGIVGMLTEMTFEHKLVFPPDIITRLEQAQTWLASLLERQKKLRDG